MTPMVCASGLCNTQLYKFNGIIIILNEFYYNYTNLMVL